MSDPPLLTTALVLTAEQVTELLAVPVETVRNLHRTRQLAGVLIGKHLRWRPDQVTAFVAALQPSGAD